MSLPGIYLIKVESRVWPIRIFVLLTGKVNDVYLYVRVKCKMTVVKFAVKENRNIACSSDILSKNIIRYSLVIN